MDLSTEYLGLKLSNPFAVGASPLVYDIDAARRLEDAGAGAVTLHSLFEEQIIRHYLGESASTGSYYPEADNFPLDPESYLEHIQKLKARLGIPVIGSLNGTSTGSWIEHGQLIEEAGADALEVNLYYLPSTEMEPGHSIETQSLQLVKMVCQRVSIPVTVKLSPFFSSLPHFVRRLEETGASGAVLFNQLFQPDIDIEALTYDAALDLSSSSDLRLRLRWIATLFGRVHLDLAVSGGVHTASDAIKAALAGASCIQMVSCLLQHGPDHMKVLIKEVTEWMKRHDFESFAQMRGSLSFANLNDTKREARSGYLQMIQRWEEKTGQKKE